MTLDPRRRVAEAGLPSERSWHRLSLMNGVGRGTDRLPVGDLYSSKGIDYVVARVTRSLNVVEARAQGWFRNSSHGRFPSGTPG